MAQRQVARLSAQIIRAYSAQAQALPLESTSAQLHITNVEPNERDHAFQVQWNDGTRAKFSYLWLRDSAPNQRPRTLQELSVNVKPVSWHLDQSGNELVIDWPPWAHNVHYTSKWLKDHTIKTQLAAHEELSILQDVKFFKTAQDPEAKAAVKKDGIVIIQSGQKKDISSLINTDHHCGTHQVDLGHYEPLHTGCPDLPSVPHYAVMSVGAKYDGQLGLLQFVDGFEAATRIRHQDTHSFDLLRKCPMHYNDYHGEERASHPIVELSDPLNEETSPISKVIFNYQQRSTTLGLSNGRVMRYYMALKMLHDTMQTMAVETPVQAGSMIVFDNWRILHGNTAFVTKTANSGLVTIDYYK